MEVDFRWTHVRYQDGDVVGLLLALCTLAPIFIVVMYATRIVFERDVALLFQCAGQLLCVGLNLILKDLLDEARPEGSHLKDPGMPSNHAQFMGFYVVYTLWNLAILARRYQYAPGGSQNASLALKAVLCLGLGAAVATSRVYLKYHSVDQVMVGLLAGALSALVWASIVRTLCKPLLASLADSFPGRYLLLCNYDGEDAQEFRWRSLRLHREREHAKRREKKT